MFPPDYATDHREFRPSNNASMKLRLESMRRCKNGRITKRRKNCLRKQCANTYQAVRHSQRLSQWLEEFEGPSNAFRNYAGISSGSVGLALGNPLSNSELITSGLVMLDGSSLETKSHTVDFNTATEASVADSTASVGSTTDRTESKSSVGNEPPMTSSEVIDRRNISLQSLGYRLSSKYSSSYLKHIASVARYSSSNSWRSSLISLRSLASSLGIERASSRQSHVAAEGIWTSDSSNASKRFSQRVVKKASGTIYLDGGKLGSSNHDMERRNETSDETGQDSHLIDLSSPHVTPTLCHEEQMMWEELIDEKTIQALISQPSSRHRSPHSRGCCVSFPSYLDTAICHTCGMTPDHRRAMRRSIFEDANFKFTSMTDFYGNTPLHCAAASTQPLELWKINTLVAEGAHVHRFNTSGQSFLHLLCQNGLHTKSDMSQFLKLLRTLSQMNFSFSTADYQGRTALHVLLSCTTGQKYSEDFLCEIFLVVRQNLNALDNSGFSASSYVMSNLAHGKELDARTQGYLNNSPALSDAQTFFIQKSSPNDLSIWIEERCNMESVRDIDAAGDTLLIAMLKHGPVDDGGKLLVECTKKLTTAKCSIHMRDRTGNTALAVATRRGLRPVAKLLLKRGAHVHSRDSMGVGILSQAEKTMIEAKRTGDERLYARILSCIMLLIEAGAKAEPTEQDEWMSRSAKAAFQRHIVSPDTGSSHPSMI